MGKKSSFPWKPVLIAAAGLGVLFCCLAVAGGVTAYYMTKNQVAQVEPVKTEKNQPVRPETQSAGEEPTALPAKTAVSKPTAKKPANAVSPTVKPSPEKKAGSVSDGSKSGLTGKQEITDHSIFDDFSSNALNWSQYDDGTYIIVIENEALSMQVKEPDKLDWVDFPVDFIPYEIKFDVKGTSGKQDGTFGVYCQNLNENNFYYVEFDLETSEYVITEVKDDVQIPLTKQNASGQYWQKTNAFKTPSTSVNRIAISCYLDNITLFINDKLVDQVDVKKPLEKTANGAFYVYAYPGAGENGYKVIFDNVEIFQPVQ
ncbi:hypothetical protein [Leptolinea tardivitalis]|uniref:3-keto-disaccharide hydrolase domain-containing protein n=1 Tax=Leptolinea tardivitalis TaxID=229920 RepID=A0A0P6XMX4_9CHLR|nr:hypothetical protein [Leptolinea tardivitalis]KPL73309.1 hypothetical protein ADM99_03585 [Leptolinea tardivitalis]GAP21441.1 hypothetical protein LTAR_01652 [Leptolinea tardivitalis]